MQVSHAYGIRKNEARQFNGRAFKIGLVCMDCIFLGENAIARQLSLGLERRHHIFESGMQTSHLWVWNADVTSLLQVADKGRQCVLVSCFFEQATVIHVYLSLHVFAVKCVLFGIMPPPSLQCMVQRCAVHMLQGCSIRTAAKPQRGSRMGARHRVPPRLVAMRCGDPARLQLTGECTSRRDPDA
eukprot:366335-Chlamydomonas_euryale.AAC.3